MLMPLMAIADAEKRMGVRAGRGRLVLMSSKGSRWGWKKLLDN